MDKPTIFREFLGGSEELPFDRFANEVIQDGDIAEQIAEWLIVNPLSEYLYNENEPQYLERFTVIHSDILREQVKAYFAERARHDLSDGGIEPICRDDI